MKIAWESEVRDADRLDAVRDSGLAALLREDDFDRLIELAIEVTGAPRGCITFVSADTTTAFSAFGFPEGLDLFAPVEQSFCRFVVGTGTPFVVEDANRDPRTIGDPAIEAFGAAAWIGYPIEDADGFVLGAFCLMDAEPRSWSRTDVMAVATLARAVSTAIALRCIS